MEVAKHETRFYVPLPKPYNEMTPDERKAFALRIAGAAKDLAARTRTPEKIETQPEPDEPRSSEAAQ